MTGSATSSTPATPEHAVLEISGVLEICGSSSRRGSSGSDTSPIAAAVARGQ